jgi:hypothetical protein
MRIVLLACLALVGLTSGGHGLEDRYAGLHRLGRRELALDRLLRVNLLTGPLFIVGPAGDARLRTDRGRQHDGRYHCLAERGADVGRQEAGRHVDPRRPLAILLAKGFIEAMSTPIVWHTLRKAVVGLLPPGFVLPTGGSLGAERERENTGVMR